MEHFFFFIIIFCVGTVAAVLFMKGAISERVFCRLLPHNPNLNACFFPREGGSAFFGFSFTGHSPISKAFISVRSTGGIPLFLRLRAFIADCFCHMAFGACGFVYVLSSSRPCQGMRARLSCAGFYSSYYT